MILGAAAIAMFITSNVYEAVSVIQPLPIYEGEDVSELPDAPEGVTVHRLSPSSFFEIRATDSENATAETANKVATDYRDARQSAARKFLKARLQAADPNDPEWLQIHQELRMPMPAIEVHRRAVPNPIPVRHETSDKQLENLPCWAVISGLLVAWGCTWYRRRRDPGDGAPVFQWKPGKFVAVCCAATLGWVILSQQLEPKKFSASVVVEVLPDAVERSESEKARSFFQISGLSEPKPAPFDWWPVLLGDGWKALVWGTLFGLFLSSWKEMRANRKQTGKLATGKVLIEMVPDPF